jgi:hypothetical protein
MELYQRFTVHIEKGASDDATAFLREPPLMEEIAE